MKTAVVAGASGGIGSALCNVLKGYKIVPIDRTHGITLQTLPELVREDIRIKGLIDVFIYCVGVGHFGRFSDLKLDNMVDMTTLNLEAAMTLTHTILPKMKKKGHLIYVASNSAHYEIVGNSVYGATKAGLRHFARTLYQEIKGDGYKVSVISPGTVDTDTFWSHGIDNRDKVVPLQPQDIGKCVEFILSSGGNVLEMEIMPDAKTH